MLVLGSSLLSTDFCTNPVYICLTQGLRGNLREENYQILRYVNLRYESASHPLFGVLTSFFLIYKLNPTVTKEWIAEEIDLYEDFVCHSQLGFCLRGKLLQFYQHFTLPMAHMGVYSSTAALTLHSEKHVDIALP